MAKTSTTVGIYCRISSDGNGDELGVDRQREDCERLAEARGWQVAATYIDNDVSAYSGRIRPDYDRMFADIEAGTIGAVVVWHPDRLHRSPRELERFIDVVETSGAQVATVQAGELDLSTAAGRMTARVVGAVARHESEQKSERLCRQREQAALQGRPHGGRRGYGYDPTGTEIIEAEAVLIREAAERVLSGASTRAIAVDWNARGVASASGKLWQGATVRNMLIGPRLAGLRVHRGEVVGEGNWPAILDRATHDRLRALLQNRAAGRSFESLLGGILVCGRCGKSMHHTRRGDGSRRYRCGAVPGSGSCGRVAIKADATEEIVVEVVLRRLDSPALAKAVAAPKGSPLREIPELETRLEELADLFGSGEISQSEWMRARKGIEARLAKARARRDSEAGTAVLAPFRGPGVLAEQWPNLSTDQQRAILGAVIERVVIAPAAENGPRRFDADRITIDWKV